MANPQSLEQLKDIHLPNPIGWWPIAWGWYLLGLLIITLLATLSYCIWKYYKRTGAKREALTLLKQYFQTYKAERNCQSSSAQVSELMRRVALAYFPREEVASLQGEAWIAFLNNHSKTVNFAPIKELILELPYRTKVLASNTPNPDLTPLFTCAKAWIKQRGKLCSN
jgi:hypothetical protein